MSADGDRLTCLDCGKTYRSLAVHIRRAHGITQDEYRERHGLPANTPLTSDATLEKIRRPTHVSCTIEGCDRPHIARGLCDLHRARRRLGIPDGQPVERQATKAQVAAAMPRMIEMRRAGASYPDIAAELGISGETVGRALRKAGVTPPLWQSPHLTTSGRQDPERRPDDPHDELARYDARTPADPEKETPVELNWKTPPPRTAPQRTARDVDAIAETLRAHPGEWALIDEGMKSSGSARTFEKRGLEATSRSRRDENGNKVFDLYVRYNPDS